MDKMIAFPQFSGKKANALRDFRRLFLLFAGSISMLVITSATAETLQKVCERLEKLGEHKRFMEGVDECRKIGDHYSSAISSEMDPLTQERYLAVRADLYQSYADTLTDEDHKKSLAVEALGCWEDYFDWFTELPPEQQAIVMKTDKAKVYAAAAEIGMTALSAGQPSDAWSRYEELDDICFGHEAINMWLAALLYPDNPHLVNNGIFAKTAENATLLARHLSEQNRLEHWRTFAGRLQNFIAARNYGKAHRDFLERLNRLMPPVPVPAASP